METVIAGGTGQDALTTTVSGDTLTFYTPASPGGGGGGGNQGSSGGNGGPGAPGLARIRFRST